MSSYNIEFSILDLMFVNTELQTQDNATISYGYTKNSKGKATPRDMFTARRQITNTART